MTDRPPSLTAMLDQLDIERPAWVADAACSGQPTEHWYPQRGESVRHARAICQRCPVRHHCLEHALDSVEKFGMWGGASERERRHIRAARNRAARRTATLEPDVDASLSARRSDLPAAGGGVPPRDAGGRTTRGAARFPAPGPGSSRNPGPSHDRGVS